MHAEPTYPIITSVTYPFDPTNTVRPRHAEHQGPWVRAILDRKGTPDVGWDLETGQFQT